MVTKECNPMECSSAHTGKRAIMRLIDVDVAIERAKESDKIVRSSIWETGEVVEFLEDCPIIVDAVEVVHGQWKKIAYHPYYCSNCGEIAPLDFEGESHYRSNYCPNCGADMRGSEE